MLINVLVHVKDFGVMPAGDDNKEVAQFDGNYGMQMQAPGFCYSNNGSGAEGWQPQVIRNNFQYYNPQLQHSGPFPMNYTTFQQPDISFLPNVVPYGATFSRPYNNNIFPYYQVFIICITIK